MSEIPEDILETTMAIFKEIWPGLFHPELFDAIAAKLLAERNQDRWQPIETAPKDTDILTYTARENHRIGVICGIHVGCFRTDLMVWHLSDDEWELEPSHWQPLPNPPVVTP